MLHTPFYLLSKRVKAEWAQFLFRQTINLLGNNGSVYFKLFTLLPAATRVIGLTAEIKTSLYLDPRRSRKFGQKSLNL